MSHELTLSARQRIVIYREISRLEASGENPARLAELKKEYGYYGDQTCATDGLCALTCPVEIDTGKLIKALRHDRLSPAARQIGARVADQMGAVTALTRFGLGLLDGVHRLLGTRQMAAVAGGLRRISGNRLPQWTAAMPKAAARVKPPAFARLTGDRVIYFPACINRSMGPPDGLGLKSLPQTTAALLEKAGYDIIYPERMDQLCCGMPFASKGLSETAAAKAGELGDALLSISDNGRIPILCDMSPCLYHMQETLDDRLQLYEPIRFTLTYLAPRLAFEKISEPIAIHTVCSAKKMGLEADFRRLAEMCAAKVLTPEVICCGFAGDRGFTVPELNAFGLRRLKKQLPPEVTAGFSTSRTCEIGLTTHSGIDYRSILYLVDQCTRPTG